LELCWPLASKGEEVLTPLNAKEVRVPNVMGLESVTVIVGAATVLVVVSIPKVYIIIAVLGCRSLRPSQTPPETPVTELPVWL
jgi:hypothetical protein